MFYLINTSSLRCLIPNYYLYVLLQKIEKEIAVLINHKTPDHNHNQDYNIISVSIISHLCKNQQWLWYGLSLICILDIDKNSCGTQLVLFHTSQNQVKLDIY